ncbi:hypothetical protein [Psychrobacillus sp. L3]|uniref:hypothetical protein n=1 Tax=Psychrobacillus sp. L3 TaxID=3236891 RepID=UPI0036F40091
MKYLKVFISIILIFFGSTLLNITIHGELMDNIIIKVLGGLMMLVGVVSGRRAIKKGKLKNVE